MTHLSKENKNQNLLKNKISKQFDAVMIDEFQDTNQSQYKIIHKLFIESLQLSDGENLDPSTSKILDNQKVIFLIGDPKQSIYAFRKADILAYLNVKQNKAFTHHTQNINWRSTPSIITALNAIFETPNPFLYPDIKYIPVIHPKQINHKNRQSTQSTSSKKSINEASLFSNDSNIKLWISKPSSEKSDVGDLQKQFAFYLIKSLQEKLSNGLPAEKIAILVHTTREIFFLKKILSQYQIPCETSHQSEILVNESTALLLRLLTAIGECEDTPLVKGILISPLFSFSVEEVQELISTYSEKWNEILLWFDTLKSIWINYGLGALLKVILVPTNNPSILDSNSLTKRLLSYQRKNKIDFYASVDFLLVEYFDNKNPYFLLSNLTAKIQIHQIHETTQTNASRPAGSVHLMTIHQSKGLEYDFIYLPFLYNMSVSKTMYQDETESIYKVNDEQIFCNKSSLRYLSESQKKPIENYFQNCQKENFDYFFSESLRLLYVALTRAKKQTFIGYAYSDFSNLQKNLFNPLYYYLHFSKFWDWDSSLEISKIGLISFLKGLKNKISSEGSLKQLEDLMTHSHGTINLDFFEYTTRELEKKLEERLARGLEEKREQYPNTKSISNANPSNSLNTLNALKGEKKKLKKDNFLNSQNGSELITLLQKYQFYSFSSLSELSKITDEKKTSFESSDLHPNHSSTDNPSSPEIKTETNKKSQEEQEENIFTFPAGVEAGNCLHDILEKTNFEILSSLRENQEKEIYSFWEKKIKKTIFENLEKYQISSSYQKVIWELLHTIASIPLMPMGLSSDISHSAVKKNIVKENIAKENIANSVTKEKGIKLTTIPNDRTLRELEFYYLLEKNLEPKTSPRHPKNLMHGFIDFVFQYNDKYYFIDWKSNYLGDNPLDYQKENLQKTMSEHNYTLQYHIYTAALHRYLKKDTDYSYEKNFGGGFYLFLRGLNASKKETEALSQNGIFFVRPTEEKIESLYSKFLF